MYVCTVHVLILATTLEYRKQESMNEVDDYKGVIVDLSAVCLKTPLLLWGLPGLLYLVYSSYIW